MLIAVNSDCVDFLDAYETPKGEHWFRFLITHVNGILIVSISGLEMVTVKEESEDPEYYQFNIPGNSEC